MTASPPPATGKHMISSMSLSSYSITNIFSSRCHSLFSPQSLFLIIIVILKHEGVVLCLFCFVSAQIRHPPCLHVALFIFMVICHLVRPMQVCISVFNVLYQYATIGCHSCKRHFDNYVPRC